MRALAVAALLAVVLTGCSLGDDGVERMSSATGAEVVDPLPGGDVEHDFSVADPGPLHARPVSANLLVIGRSTLPLSLLRRIEATSGVRASEPLSLASAVVGGRVLTIGSVDPATYRRFTPERAARTTAVWQRVAEGDLALSPDVAEDLRQPLGGQMMLGNDRSAVGLRVGAHASMAPRIDAVVNHERGRQLGMVPRNAVLVAVRDGVQSEVEDDLERLTGRRAVVGAVSRTPPAEGTQTAFLTGGSVAAAVGSFSYHYFENGSVDPDPAWVAANIRTEDVPILGSVTCHRVLFPQLRAALQEVVDSGLTSSVDAGDFGGCYVPRFIDSDPTRGLSLHTWGIAVDLNVAGNHRGTAGEIDPRVVEIFKRWGFAWGGDWDYTDPMHFELAALVRPR